MKEVIKILVLSITISYLSVSFITADLNPFIWSQAARSAMLLLVLAVGACVIMIKDIININNKKK